METVRGTSVASFVIEFAAVRRATSQDQGFPREDSILASRARTCSARGRETRRAAIAKIREKVRGHNMCAHKGLGDPVLKRINFRV